MKYRLVFLTAVILSLAACGGGSNDAKTDSTSAQSSSAYSLVAPTQGAQNLYSETLLDNLNNSINRNIIHTVLNVNSDGTFSIGMKDPSNNISKSGTVDHSFYPTIYDYSNQGNAIDRTISFPDGTSTKCVVSAYISDSSGGPRIAGGTINSSFTETCGKSPSISYKISSLYVGQESIAVPAGTFLAAKFQDTVTYTTPSGTNVTDAAVYWRSVTNLGSTLIKANDIYTYTGATPPQGSTVSTLRVLQSQHL